MSIDGHNRDEHPDIPGNGAKDGDAAGNGEKKEPMPPPRRRRSPGFTNRRHRERMEKAVIRYRLETSGPNLTDAEIDAKVEEEYALLLPHDPMVKHFFEETAPVSVCPSRRGLHSEVEVKAVRSLQPMRELEEMLRMSAYGRPTDRRLVVAAFERNILENGRPEIIAHYKSFQVKNEALGWAYDWPARDGSNRDQSSVYRTLHSTLLRCNADICLEMNVRALVELRKQLGCSDIGRYLVIDGTAVPAPREQRSSDPNYRAVEEKHLRRGIEQAAFTTHGGRKTWRGPRLVYLTDVKTNLPIGFNLLPSDRPEYVGLGELLERIHELWEKYAQEPWEPEYLVGDAHFDNENTHRMLEERFAIHPVIPLKDQLGQHHDFWDNKGTPTCAKHGDMKLIQSQYFVDHAKRRQLGLRPGEPADLSQASFRWKCVDTSCPVTAQTSWQKSPRAHPYLPFKGVHRSRVALRKALMLRRNASESLNARLKGRGIGNGGMNVPKWVSTDGEMAWLCFGTSVAFTLLRLAHDSGAYESAREEADSHDLLNPCQPKALFAGSSSACANAA